MLEPAEVDLAELVRDAVGAARARTEVVSLPLETSSAAGPAPVPAEAVTP